MPQLFDTHIHLDHPQLWPRAELLTKQAAVVGVTNMTLIACSVENIKQLYEWKQDHPGMFLAAGISPHDSAKTTNEHWELLLSSLKKGQLDAIGEIGFDFYYDYPREQQKEVFLRQWQLASEYDLPVIIHLRQAGDYFIQLLKTASLPLVKGVLHCFSGDQNLLTWSEQNGFYISYTGVITFKNAHKARENLKNTALDRLMLETDAPYMAPEPFRGKTCEPAMLTKTAKIAAKELNLSYPQLASISFHNAQRFFSKTKTESCLVYPYKNNLYINLTRHCSNQCKFCLKWYTDYLQDYHLYLATDPTVPEILAQIPEDLAKYDEIDFCGLGEPTTRLKDLLVIARELKKRGKKIRLNTNGQGALINGYNIIPELKENIDAISVSLNTLNPKQYLQLCRPQKDLMAFKFVKDFIIESQKAGLEVTVTVVDLPEVNIDAVRLWSKKNNVKFRVRRLGRQLLTNNKG